MAIGGGGLLKTKKREGLCVVFLLDCKGSVRRCSAAGWARGREGKMGKKGQEISFQKKKATIQLDYLWDLLLFLGDVSLAYSIFWASV